MHIASGRTEARGLSGLRCLRTLGQSGSRQSFKRTENKCGRARGPKRVTDSCPPYVLLAVLGEDVNVVYDI